MALGEIAAACKSPAADEAVAALQARKPGKVPTLERMLAAGADVCRSNNELEDAHSHFCDAYPCDLGTYRQAHSMLVLHRYGYSALTVL